MEAQSHKQPTDYSTKPLLAQLRLLEAQSQVIKINIRQQEQSTTKDEL